jgi:hypothetical protein
MTDDEWSRLSDQQLAKVAKDDLQGQGAPVEAMRRLRTALEKASESNDRYSRKMFWLTLIITLLTAVQLIGAIDIVRHWVK